MSPRRGGARHGKNAQFRSSRSDCSCVVPEHFHQARPLFQSVKCAADLEGEPRNRPSTTTSENPNRIHGGEVACSVLDQGLAILRKADRQMTIARSEFQ